MELRRSPLHGEHLELGAKLTEFGGWEMPLSYSSGTIAEHMACRNDAVAFDVSHLGTVRLDSADSLALLQQSFTNDLGKIAPGRAQYTHLLDPEDASVIDDIIVWWVDSHRFDVMPNASNTHGVRSVVGGVDVTSNRAVIAVQGPRSRERVGRVFPEVAAVPHFGVTEFNFMGAPCIVSGTGYTGEDGFECAIAAEVSPAFWRAVLSTGVIPAGLGARDTLRLEAALPLHSHELGPGITPLQAGLGWVVSWDKGNFRGRNALDAERQRGISRRLRALCSSGRRPPHTGDGIYAQNEFAGEVTSGNFSPVLGRGIALGFVPPNLVIGEVIEIATRGTRAEATIVKPPFHRLSI